MSEEVYEKLAYAIINRAASIPVIDCPEFRELIKALFTPEQAELSALLPMKLLTAKDISALTDRQVDEVTPLMESMAKAGLVFVTERKGETLYKVMDVLPGFFEFQFMKGGRAERDKVISHRFRDYFEQLQGTLRNVPEPFRKITPFSRVIPVNKKIQADTVVHPYETLAEYINMSEHITVSPCYCRHYGELLDNPCDYPKEVCMAFGPNAKFVADYGFGRLVSKEEALKILNDVEEHGLVHVSSNTSKYIDFICNCCACHCGVLQSFVESEAPSMGVIANFDLVIDKDTCVGCGECGEKCPVQALTVVDDVSCVDALRCIGCGVCNVTCPTESLSMKRRADSIEPPLDRRGLQERIMQSLQDAISEVSEKADA